MNILHYSLGFPPFRRGGMTQYCLDLMLEQVKAGHQVSLLWPGRLYDLTQKSKVNEKQKYKLQNDLYCTSYELLNPLPIPLMDGIQDPATYLVKKEKTVYIEFFQKHTFQMLHIHTFMGLPSELIEAAHEVGVKTVFTTHDYFPICPRCNLFHSGKDCQDDKKCSDCVSCNQYGLSFNKMKFFQSELYKRVKESSVIKMLRARHNRKMYDATEQVIESEIIDAKKQKKYQNLRDRNIELLEKMDAVHFNSTNTLWVYKKRGYTGNNANVISISNGAIVDHKRIRKVGSSVRFGYLGPLTTHKGYNLFKNACDALWLSGEHNFEAHIFVEVSNPSSYMICHKPYSYKELPNVMNQFDVLVTPSEWEETFGFTVLEALSYGIPVIVSEKVGAKDLILEGKNGFVVASSVETLKFQIADLVRHPSIIDDMNAYIEKNFKVKTMKEHSYELNALYKKLLS